MTNAERVMRMRARLEEVFQPTRLEIVDESHLHAGHAGAATGKGHFRVLLVAEQFRDVRPLQRHRMVYEALDDMMTTDIHALSIRAIAPGEPDATASSP